MSEHDHVIAGDDAAAGCTGRPVAKRRRIAIACGSCRIRKAKCDGLRPTCTPCDEQGITCVYSASQPLKASSAPRDCLCLGRMSQIEDTLQRLSARLDAMQQQAAVQTTPRQPQAHLSVDADDFGASHQDPSDGIGSIAFRDEPESGFFGPSSNIAFTRCVVRAITAILNRKQTSSTLTMPVGPAKGRHLAPISRPPSPRRNSLGLPAVSIEAQSPFCVPQYDDTRSLIRQYFVTTGALFPFIHEPSFLETYEEAVQSKFTNVRRTWLGLLYMMLAMATSTAIESAPSGSQPNVDSLECYQRARAVCERNVRIGNSLENVQLLLLMSQYLQGTSRSIETWGVHGLAVKAAYQLGLHSKDALRPHSPLEREFRTRTWYCCVLLDRSLSMTLGRPTMIPESHVKLDPPRSLLIEPIVSTLGSVQVEDDAPQVAFLTATISLYKTLQEALVNLYGENLACGASPEIYDMASRVLQTDHKLLAWQSGLPPSTALIDVSDVKRHQAQEACISRFRVVLTLRYLNVRILVHRPLLQEFLTLLERSSSESCRESATLRQLGSGSLSTCTESAVRIIDIVSEIVCTEDGPTYLLGASWFCFFYVFNAALVVCSSLIVQFELEQVQEHLSTGSPPVRLSLLGKATECLRKLDKGTGVMKKCADYLTTLVSILDTLYPASDNEANCNDLNGTDNLGETAKGLHFSLDLENAGDCGADWLSTDFTQLMDPTDLDFWNVDINLPDC